MAPELLCALKGGPRRAIIDTENLLAVCASNQGLTRSRGRLTTGNDFDG